ncbi:MAG: restriction endonuclease subunit S, partial [Chloroflexi bacterium]|nr:restriction endonuclease subunit S [Chloroflexota bacterium]
MPGEVPFADLAQVNPRRGLKRGGQYPYVEMAAVPEGGGTPTHHEEREFEGGGSKFAVGDTLFARITPCTENGKIAYVDSLPGDSVGFGSTELIVLAARPDRADPRFVYQVSAWARVRRQAVARMLGTSGRQRVPTWFFTEELRIPAFSLPEQRRIAAVLDAIDEAIERSEGVVAATEGLR